MRTVEDLQKEVWTLHDRDMTPLTQLVAATPAGGQLIGYHVADFFRQSRGSQSVGVYVLSHGPTREDLR